MCSAPKILPPPPAPKAPPTLEQIAPKSVTTSNVKKRKGLSRYKIESPKASTNKIGGIPKKTGV